MTYPSSAAGFLLSTLNFHQLETPINQAFPGMPLKKTVYQKFHPDVGEYSIHGSLWVSPSLDSHPVANHFSHDARWTCNHRSLGNEEDRHGVICGAVLARFFIFRFGEFSEPLKKGLGKMIFTHNLRLHVCF